VLETLDLSKGIRIELRRVIGLELLDELESEVELVLVDATRTGRPPGTCHVMELIDAAALAGTPYCCHGMSVAEILEIARRMFPERLPPRIAVVGVEAEELDDYGTRLSPSMQRALPEAVDLVLQTIGASETTRETARREAERWRDWEPSVEEVFGLKEEGGTNERQEQER